MQRSPSQPHAFTLIEMITVIAIIAILSGLVLTIAGSVQRKGYQTRAETDVRTMAAGCEAYKTDNGGYPQENKDNGSSVTNEIDPRVDTSPTSSKYAASSLYLYKQLSGDENANGKIEGAEVNRKYISDFFKPSRFDAGYKKTGNVLYIIDPFGYSYGYSTAGLKMEQDYRAELEKDASANRPSATKGYNPTFDLWSTAGATTSSDADKARWIKNW